MINLLFYAIDYDKGKDNGDPDLYQNLPLELLGEKGLSDVMFFINPILEKMYLYSCGGMSKFVDGEYLLDLQLGERYGGYVTDLQEKIFKNRIEYMKQDDKVDILFKEVQENNPANFLEWFGTYAYMHRKEE